MARNLKLFLALLLVTSVAHGQVLLSKFGPVSGVLVGTANQPQTAAATIADLQPILSTTPGLVLNSATGGSKGAGTINATGLYVNGSAVGVGGGAVSSVGISVPSGGCFGTSGSPVTSSGTLGVTLSGTTSQYVDGTGGCQTTAIGANPTGLIGLTAVNGTATTFARSDGHSALDQSISPTWTGAHSFNGGFTVGAASSVAVVNSTTATNAATVLFERGGTAFAQVSNEGTAGGINVGSSVGDLSVQVRNHNFGLSTNSGTSIALGVSAAGNVTVAAPSSGTSLSVTGFANSNAVAINGPSTTGQSFGVQINAGTNSSDRALRIQNAAGTANYFGVAGDGSWFAGPLGLSSMAMTAAGNVTIGAPSSGVSLTVSSPTATNRVAVFDSAQANGPYVAWTDSGTDVGYVGNSASVITGGASPDLAISATGAHQLILGTNSTSRVTIGGAGNVTVAAPSSGVAFSATSAVGNSDSADVVSTAATGQSFGLSVSAGTNVSDAALRVFNKGFASQLFIVAGDGSAVIGSPTGGAKGVGSLNAQSMFVQGVPVVTGAGSNQQIASVVGTCSGGGCTAVNAKGISTTITRNSAGNYTVTFSPPFSAQPSCVASANGTAGGIGTFTIGGTSSGTVITYVAAVATDMQWNLVCTG